MSAGARQARAEPAIRGALLAFRLIDFFGARILNETALLTSR